MSDRVSLLLLDSPWLAGLAWVAAWSADYFLTVAATTLRVRAGTDGERANLELNPYFRADVGRMRWLPKRFLRVLVEGVIVYTSLVWGVKLLVSHGLEPGPLFAGGFLGILLIRERSLRAFLLGASGLAVLAMTIPNTATSVVGFALGYLFFTKSPVVLDHLVHIALAQRHPHRTPAVHVDPQAAARQAAWISLERSVLLAVCMAVTRNAWLAGGAVGCAMSARAAHRWSQSYNAPPPLQLADTAAQPPS